MKKKDQIKALHTLQGRAKTQYNYCVWTNRVEYRSKDLFDVRICESTDVAFCSTSQMFRKWHFNCIGNESVYFALMCSAMRKISYTIFRFSRLLHTLCITFLVYLYIMILSLQSKHQISFIYKEKYIFIFSFNHIFY